MKGRVKRDRAQRRHIRVKCKLVINGREIYGFSRNISASGLYVCIPTSALSSGFGIEPGSVLGISFAFPGQTELCLAQGKVAWVNASDSDVDGRPVVGMGLQLVQFEVGDERLLGSFVDGFRYTVLVASRHRSLQDSCRQILGDEYLVVENLDSTASEILSDITVLVVDADDDSNSGLETVRYIVRQMPNAHICTIVLATAAAGSDRLGALVNSTSIYRYLRKPIDPTELRQTVRSAIDACVMAAEKQRLPGELRRTIARLDKENTLLLQRVAGVGDLASLVRTSPALGPLLSAVDVTGSEPIHIVGEAGTGKEMVARALHAAGPRAEQKLILYTCTSASDALAPLFERAAGGSLLLEDVTELSAAAQQHLLAVLNADISAVANAAANAPISNGVRLMTTARRELSDEVAAGRFHKDLFTRLTAVSIKLPPLRQRGSDIVLLARHFLELSSERYGKNLTEFSTDVMQVLQTYRWPGNVRELEIEIEQIALRADDGLQIQRSVLSPQIVTVAASEQRGDKAVFLELGDRSMDQLLADVERELIVAALTRHQGNRSAAAKELKLARQTLQDRMKKLGMATET